MLKLGITGGLGTGKSTVSGMLVKKGLPVLDTDDLARKFTQPGQPALAEVVAHFGPEIIDADGTLRRGVLAARVFSDTGDRRRLEAILHPTIRRAWMRQLQDWSEAGRRAGCIVIPLLYETGCEGAFDAVICTACGAASQRERLRQRDWSEDQIDGRLSAQLPLKQKMERADFVIWTEGDLATTEAQLEPVLRGLAVSDCPAGAA